MESYMQGYHVYKDIWAAMIVDLLCEREPFNGHRYTPLLAMF